MSHAIKWRLASPITLARSRPSTPESPSSDDINSQIAAGRYAVPSLIRIVLLWPRRRRDLQGANSDETTARGVHQFDRTMDRVMSHYRRNRAERYHCHWDGNGRANCSLCTYLENDPAVVARRYPDERLAVSNRRAISCVCVMSGEYRGRNFYRNCLSDMASVIHNVDITANPMRDNLDIMTIVTFGILFGQNILLSVH